MDCSICGVVPLVLRPPRNTICGGCHEAARTILSLINKLECDKGTDKSNTSSVSLPNSSKGFPNVLKWVKEMKEVEEKQIEKIDFLGGFVTAFFDQLHTDIQIKPGYNGTPIPAHKALLAARSEIFKNMLEYDACISAPSDTITLPELNHEELRSLLEFLYNGNLPPETAEKHIHSLSIVADKYEIPFLQKFCESRMLESLNASNAFDVLEISDICSNPTLKETALNFIVKNMEETIFSTRYDTFALKNAHLGVQITRAIMIDFKNRKSGI